MRPSAFHIKLGVAALLLAAACTVLSSQTEAFQIDLEQRTYYAALDATGRDPAIDPRLKILSFDDSSVAKIQSTTLSVLMLVKVLKVLHEQGVRTVLVNSLFGFPSDSPEDLKEAERMASEMSDMRVAFGAFAADRIKYRMELPKRAFDASSWVQDAPGKGPVELPSKIAPGPFVYGPPPRVARLTDMFGHLAFLQHGTVAQLFFRLAERRYLAALPLMMSEDIWYREPHLEYQGRAIATTDEGKAMILLPREEAIQRRNYSLRAYIGTTGTGVMNSDSSLSGSSGDVVLLDLTGFTGAGQLAPSPRGPVRGASQTFALMNALLTDQFVRMGDWRALACGIAAVLAGLTGLFAGSRTTRFTVLAFGAVLTYAAAATATFIYASTYVPAIGPMGSFLAVFGLLHVGFRFEANRRKDKESLLFQKDLDLANRIQDSLMPPKEVRIFDSYSVACMQAKHDALGGDWMAYRPGEGDEVFFAVGDATGKGVQAALICHAVQSLWADALSSRRFDPEAFLKRTNATLLTLGQNQPHTLTLGILRMTPTELTYWSAGHVPVVVQTELETHRMAASGDILGLSETLHLNVRRKTLDPAATRVDILLASDGVLSSSLTMSTKRIRQLVLGVEERGLAHLEAIEEADDKTLIVIRRGASQANALRVAA